MSELALVGATLNGAFRLSITLGERLHPDAPAADEAIDMIDATIALRVGSEGDYRARQPAMVMGRELAWWLRELSAFAAGGDGDGDGDGELTLTNLESGFELTVARAADGDWPFLARGFVQQSYGARLTFWEIGVTAGDLAALRGDLRAAVAAHPAHGA